MRRSGSVVLALVLSLGAAAAPPGHARTARPDLRSCAPRLGAAVLLSDAHAQIYERPSGERRAGVYGCLRRGGTAVYLGDSRSYEGTDCPRKEGGHCVSASELVLAGTTVAYLTSPVEPGYTNEEAVVARSIATRGVLHRVTIHVRTIHRTFLEWAVVLQIVAKPDGSIAWIQEDSFAYHGGGKPPPTAYSVFAVDRNGFRAPTPELPTRPRSLTLAGSVLSWANESTRENAILD